MSSTSSSVFLNQTSSPFTSPSWPSSRLPRTITVLRSRRSSRLPLRSWTSTSVLRLRLQILPSSSLPAPRSQSRIRIRQKRPICPCRQGRHPHSWTDMNQKSSSHRSHILPFPTLTHILTRNILFLIRNILRNVTASQLPRSASSVHSPCPVATTLPAHHTRSSLKHQCRHHIIVRHIRDARVRCRCSRPNQRRGSVCKRSCDWHRFFPSRPSHHPSC